MEEASQIVLLRKTIYKMEFLFNAVDEAIAWVDGELNVEWCNHVFDEFIGYARIEILGKNIIELFDLSKIKPLNPRMDSFELGFKSVPDNWTRNEFTYSRKGRTYIFQISIKKFELEAKDKSFVVVIRDITEQQKLQRQLQHLAHYDLLTSLPNRMQLESVLKRELGRAERHQREFSIFFIDIDKFKQINDTYGHGVGDLFLKEFSIRLINNIRQEDFVARLGGDEFVAVISEVQDHDVILAIANKLVRTLNGPYIISDHKIEIAISIGISHYPNDGETKEELISQADARMYEVKEAGGNAAVF